ncbi:MAG TPA: ABC transporter substrate-binding protein [Pseudomonadales bacterium]|jgi:iron complex transport system substrate-binding protein
MRLRVFLCLLFCFVTPAWASAPQRVVSLNLCTDLLILELLPRHRIMAVTELAVDPVYSVAAGRAQGLPIVDQDLESILSFKPDLVLATGFSDPYTVQRLGDMGVPVVQLEIPTTVDGTSVFIMAVAEALGESAAGARLNQQFRARWQQLGEQAAQRTPQRVLLYRPGGVTMGSGTLEDTVLQQAGLINVAADMGLQQWAQLSLESVLQARPDVLLLDDDGRHSDSLAQGMGRHPALRAAGIPTRTFSHRNWICPGPALTDAVAVLMDVGS